LVFTPQPSRAKTDAITGCEVQALSGGDLPDFPVRARSCRRRGFTRPEGPTYDWG